MLTSLSLLEKYCIVDVCMHVYKPHARLLMLIKPRVLAPCIRIKVSLINACICINMNCTTCGFDAMYSASCSPCIALLAVYSTTCVCYV